MKNTDQTFAQSHPKTVIGITTVALMIMFFSLQAYDSSVTESGDETIKNTKFENTSSISMINGVCVINYNIMASTSKYALLNDLKREILTETKSKKEIPAFIISFMESISDNSKFEMADPGESWYVNDIMGFTLSKMYDSKIKDTVEIVTPSQKVLPNNQFVYFGIGKNMALLSYYSGGLRITQHVVMIRFKNNKVIDFWTRAYEGLKTDNKADIMERIMNEGNC